MSDIAERLRTQLEEHHRYFSQHKWVVAPVLKEAADWIAAEPTRIRAAVEAERERAAGRKAGRIVEKMIPLTTITIGELAKLCASSKVCIRSDNGWWREGGSGYTNSVESAGVYSGKDAYAATRHCGPEKSVQYAILEAAIRRGE